MVARPIIFSAPMVQALLAGRKTQTRRHASSPLAQAAPGDRLYVRESVAFVGNVDPPWCLYRASGYAAECARLGFDAPYPPERSVRWTPSIHMPRRVSRLTLVVTKVRRQRLQEISDKDAEAEGVEWESADPPFFYVPGIHPHSLTAVETREGAGASFRKLWVHLHGAGAWDRDPPIVALTFTVHRCNIDAMEPAAHG